MTQPAFYLEFRRLFDAGEYFEAHEVLEDLWRVTEGPDRKFYQGLIQLAVVLHHVRRGNVVGARNVLITCRNHLAPYRPRHRDLDVDALLAFADRVDERLDRQPLALPEDIPHLAP